MPRLVLTLALAIALVPAAARAQGSSAPAAGEATTTELQTRLKHRRFVVHPRVDPGADVEPARAEIEAHERQERLLRESGPPRSRRPDLDPTVTRGLQGRNLQRALGR